MIGSATVPNVDLIEWTTNGIQNGADAVALYMDDAANFPNGTAVTATNLVDAIVYDTNDSDDAGLLAVLGGDQINEDANNDSETDSVGRLPDGTGAFTTVGDVTPGASNGGAPPAVILFVNKSGSPPIATEGANVTYTISVTNNGTDPAADVTITDTLPTGSTFVSETSPGDVSIDDMTPPDIEWSTASVDPGESFDIELVVTLPAGIQVNEVEVNTSSAGDDPGDNIDTATTTVTAVISPPAGLRINEIRIDQPSGDDDEYFELKGTPATDLTGLTYVVIGDGAGGSGVLDEAISLTGQSVQPDGLFLNAEGSFTLTGTPDANLDMNFENSDNVAHLLVANFTGGPGMDLDTDDDGTIDVTPWSDIVDGVGLVEEVNPPASTEFDYSDDLGIESNGPDGTFVPGHSYRCETDGTWQIGAFDPGDAAAVDTPDAENEACPCPDTNGDNTVNVTDLVNVILDWDMDGSINGGDVNGDGIVNVLDLLAVILSWGNCP